MVNRYVYGINEQLKKLIPYSYKTIDFCQRELLVLQGHRETRDEYDYNVNAILWNDPYNVLHDIQLAEAYANDKSEQIENYLRKYAEINPNPMHLYSTLVTQRNAKIADVDGHWGIINSADNNPYKILKKPVAKAIRAYCRKHPEFINIASAVETAIFKGLKENREDFVNTHQHGFFGVVGHALGIPVYQSKNKSTEFKSLEAEVNHQLDLAGYQNEEINIRINPLLNRIDDNRPVVIDDDTSDSDYLTANIYAQYIFKMKKLPIAHNKYDVEAFGRLTKTQRERVIMAILNSTHGLRLRSTLSFKSRKRKLIRIVDTMIKNDQCRLFALLRSKRKRLKLIAKLSRNFLPHSINNNFPLNDFCLVDFRYCREHAPPSREI